MKLRGPIFFSVLLATLLVAAFYPKFDDSKKESLLMFSILKVMNQLHYQPPEVNDKFSRQFFDLYLDRIDSGRRFLTQQDIKQLEKYKTDLDDEALTGKFDFFNLSLELLNKGIDKTQNYYREILAEPFDLTKDEYIELDTEKREFSKSDAELREFWRLYLKYQAVSRITDNLDAQEEIEDGEAPKTIEELEKEAREDLIEQYDDWFSRMKKIKRATRLSYYLSAFTNIFDPHSDYLQPRDKQNFDIRVNGRLEGIGATLSQLGEYTKVSSIVVGGPAWKGKELQENDIILKVRQEDEEEAVDMTGLLTQDVVTYIRGKKGTKVYLTVKKQDGSIKEIEIVRDLIEFEETFAKSLILDGAKPNEKIGYINLPSFYADYNSPDGRKCSKDIAKELEKMKAEGVDGVILDVRNNGGGYLNEVVNMSGLFIEEGPIVQAKYRGRDPEIWEDVDPRVQYDGPLVIMTNVFSASASEILAAAMQDYGRALIVGSKSTHGKGTVQRFWPLDRLVQGNEDLKPLGEVKLTIQKYYRIDGGSVQLRGVTPDIVLPDTYHYVEMGERDYDNPLPWTEIDALSFDQNVYQLRDVEQLRASSEKRVAESEVFNKILENAERIKMQREETKYPLDMEKFQALAEKRNAKAEAFKDLFDQVVNTNVKNLKDDLERVNADEAEKERNKNFIESVSKDVHIHETLNIMHDLISTDN
jgi:carboxyl-terminal processing protease